jgi:hypothetical protein
VFNCHLDNILKQGYVGNYLRVNVNIYCRQMNYIISLSCVLKLTLAYTSVAHFTKKCKTKIKKSFTKILTIILSVKIVLTLRVKLPYRKCKILILREIFVLSFNVSEKKQKKKMDDALALRLENKRAIHR